MVSQDAPAGRENPGGRNSDWLMSLPVRTDYRVGEDRGMGRMTQRRCRHAFFGHGANRCRECDCTDTRCRLFQPDTLLETILRAVRGGCEFQWKAIASTEPHPC